LPKLGNARTWLSLVIFTAVIAAMDYWFLSYLLPKGLESKMQQVQVAGVQFSFPLLGLTFVGLLILAAASWSNMLSMPIATLKEMSQLEGMRILRAAGVSLFFFATMLYGPYVLGSNAFWGQMSALSRAVPQLTGSLQGLFYFLEPMMGLDVVAKFAISQNAAGAGLVLASGLIVYTQRRIRRQR